MLGDAGPLELGDSWTPEERIIWPFPPPFLEIGISFRGLVLFISLSNTIHQAVALVKYFSSFTELFSLVSTSRKLMKLADAKNKWKLLTKLNTISLRIEWD